MHLCGIRGATVAAADTPEAIRSATRELGWDDTALMCFAEMAVPGGLPRCIRVLIHWNTEKWPDEIRHVYLHAAVQLRHDRAARATD